MPRVKNRIDELIPVLDIKIPKSNFDILYYSTNVECAGQCLANTNCSAFHFSTSTKTCRTLKSDHLYKNKNDTNTINIYENC